MNPVLLTAGLVAAACVIIGLWRSPKKQKAPEGPAVVMMVVLPLEDDEEDDAALVARIIDEVEEEWRARQR